MCQNNEETQSITSSYQGYMIFASRQLRDIYLYLQHNIQESWFDSLGTTNIIQYILFFKILYLMIDSPFPSAAMANV